MLRFIFMGFPRWLWRKAGKVAARAGASAPGEDEIRELKEEYRAKYGHLIHRM